MDVILKKYFWVVPIMVVVMCSALAAKSVNYYIESKVLMPSENPPKVPDGMEPLTKSPRARSKNGAPLAERNMFCAECLPEEVEPVLQVSTSDDSVVMTSLPIELVATMVALNKSNSFATIRHTKNEWQSGFAIQDKIPGAGKVVAIRGKYVDFHNREQRIERVSLDSENLLPAKKKSVAKPVVTPPFPRGIRGARAKIMSLLSNGLKKTGENRWEIDRSVVEEVTKNPMLVARGARVVPSIKNGKTQGLKLYAVRPNSVYAKLGLMNGDTLHSVNNFDLSDFSKSLEIYTKLREANLIVVDLTRRGKRQSMTYQIK